jgi:hypothetical protein
MGKRDSFWHMINFILGISLYLPKQVFDLEIGKRI